MNKNKVTSVMKKINNYVKDNKRIVILVAILIILIIADIIKSKIELEKLSNRFLAGIEVEDYDEYMEGLKDVHSDIEGLSQYDKYVMGLDYHDGSDSDHDGLTDKEELEIYGTDPLSTSTSGDLYTDGYKINNGLELDKAYELDNVAFDNNECKEVELTADTATDLMAVVEDATGRYSLTDYGIDKVYKSYFVYNYSGEITIDLTDTLDDNDITLSDIDVRIYEGTFLVYGLSDLEKCKYSTEDNNITLKKALETDKSYYIFIIDKNSFITTLMNSVKAKASSHLTQVNNSKEDDIVFLVTGTPMLGIFRVYYPKQSDEEMDEYYKNRAKEVFNNDEKNPTYIAISSDKIKEKYEKIQSIFPNNDITDTSKRVNMFEYILLGLYGYYYYEDTEATIALSASTGGTNSEDSDELYYNNYHTNFDPYVDELPFQNFASQYSSGGNCAGMAYLTSYLYNNGYFPTSDSYNDTDWDLTIDNENDTLSDLGLSDYKTKYFVDDNSGKTNDITNAKCLSDGEKEFIKMTGSYTKKVNETVAGLREYMITNDWSLDWSVAETMTDYLDNGKIINIGLYLADNTGHAITLYDYYYNTSGELIFRVYDSNIPQNHMDDVELTCDGACYLQCKKVLRTDGTYGMEYLYYPVKDDLDYVASSNLSIMSTSSMVVYDDQLNTLN